MIVRDEGHSFLLITQPEHARLARDIVSAIGTEPVLRGVTRDSILLATLEHDNGWREVDAEPTIDPATFRPCDFINGPANVKHELWPRGIRRTARIDPRAGALIAEHALTVYSYRAQEREWQPFFAGIGALRHDLLRQIGAFDGPARDAFAQEYRCVRLGDLLSLQFCNGWTKPQETLGYHSRLERTSGNRLLVSPDPFGSSTVPLRVMARRIPARRYTNDADLRAALAAAEPEWLDGTACGDVPSSGLPR